MTNLHGDNAEQFSDEAGRIPEALDILEILSDEFNRDILKNTREGASKIAEKHNRPKQHVYNRFNNKLKNLLLADKSDRAFETRFMTSLAAELEEYLEEMEEIYTDWRMEYALRSLIEENPEVLSGFDAIIPEGETTLSKEAEERYEARSDYSEWRSKNPILSLFTEGSEEASEVLAGFNSIIYEDSFKKEEEVKEFFNELSEDDPSEESKKLSKFRDYRGDDAGKDEEETTLTDNFNSESLKDELGLNHNFYHTEVYQSLGTALSEIGYKSFEAAISEVDAPIENGDVPEEVEKLIEIFNQESEELNISRYDEHGSYLTVKNGMEGPGVINEGEGKLFGESRKRDDFLIIYKEKDGTYKMTGMSLAEKVGAIKSPDQLESIAEKILE